MCSAEVKSPKDITDGTQFWVNQEFALMLVLLLGQLKITLELIVNRKLFILNLFLPTSYGHFIICCSETNVLNEITN